MYGLNNDSAIGVFREIDAGVDGFVVEYAVVNDTLKLSHLPRSMFKKRGVKVSHC